MLKFLSRLKKGITGETRPERVDAKNIYAHAMKQARNPAFFTDSLVADDTDGRMEWLSAHLALIMHALAKQGADGATLSQAIYDVMIDDFDVALREEGLTDSGVKHRIKPLAKMYLTRARTYADALEGSGTGLADVLKAHVVPEAKPTDIEKLKDYLLGFSKKLGDLTLDQIAQTEIEFPEL